MSNREHIVLTGATGFIGRHLALAMLDRPTLHLSVIVRGENQNTAIERVIACLREAACSAMRPFEESRARAAIHVLVGDVTEPSCGVDVSDLLPPQAGERIEFWHVAASLRFEDSRSRQIHEQNVDGTRNAIDLARTIGAARFVYLSTAYVAGATEGEMPESLLASDRAFNNAYEHSKCLAEQLVHERCTQVGLDYQIVRPSIVIGDSRSHAPAGSDTGLYGFVRETLRIRRLLQTADRPVRIVADAQAPLNFVPVDQVVRAMLELQRQNFPGGTVHHVTSRECPSVGGTLDAICDVLVLPRFEFVAKLDSDASPLEVLLSRRTAFYASYLHGTRRFARQAGPAIDVRPESVADYVRGYLAERTPPVNLVARWLTARDGFPLFTASHVQPERETVVLVNALGIPRAALEKLERALSERYTVLTWESRGAPSLEGELDQPRSRFARHADDLEDLLACHEIERAHIVGWCTGADVALDFARRAPERVQSLVCLNGSFVGVSSKRTPYQRSLERIVRRAAESEPHASLFHTLLSQLLSAPAGLTDDISENSQAMRSALSVLDPELLHITGEPLRSAASFFRYCVLLRSFFDEAPRSVPSASLRALVVSAEDDAIAHAGASREVAALLGAELQVTQTGGHFAPCKDDALIARVSAFLARSAASRGSVVSFNPRAEFSTASVRFVPSAPAA